MPFTMSFDIDMKFKKVFNSIYLIFISVISVFSLVVVISGLDKF